MLAEACAAEAAGRGPRWTVRNRPHVPQGNRAPEGHEVPVVRARLHNGTHAALQRDLGEDVVAQVPQHAAGVGQLGAAQVDLVVCHHADELENLLPAGDEARAQHVVHAEGLGRRGGRRGGVVRRVGKLLPQLQVVQNEAVAVVGYAEAVRGFAVRGSSEVGADTRPPEAAPSSAYPARRQPSRGSGPGPWTKSCRPGGSCRR